MISNSSCRVSNHVRIKLNHLVSVLIADSVASSHYTTPSVVGLEIEQRRSDIVRVCLSFASRRYAPEQNTRQHMMRSKFRPKFKSIHNRK